MQNLAEESQNLLKQSEELQKSREFLHQTYEHLAQYSVWPFNKGMVLRFISTQGIPLLSLTGAGELIVGALKILFAQ